MGNGEDEEEQESISVGLVRRERKEVVEMAVGPGWLKDCCNHGDASVSGQGEFKNI